MSRAFWLSPLFLFLTLFAPHAQAVREIPRLTGPVMDEVGLLDSASREQLAQELATYPPLLQLQIWIVNSLEGEPIESLSIRAAEAWKLGTEKKDNGVIVLLAVADRRSRIEVGQGLEGVLPDALAGRILRNVLAPRMRANQADLGLLEVSQVVHALAAKEMGADDHRISEQASRGRKSYFWLFILVVVVLSITRLMDTFSAGATLLGGGLGGLSGTRARRRRGGGFFDGGFGGGGGFGSGGGGWSGGGGGFSGGGSSGGW